MTVPDVSDAPPSELGAMRRNWAEGEPSQEAAVQLIIGHGVWLARPDFRRACVSAVDNDSQRPPAPMAAISWERAARFLDGVPASRSEVAVLRLACSLAGVNTGSLRELTAGLDPANTARVLDALAHGEGWHERGIRHTVDGRQDGITGAGPAMRA